MCARNVLRDNTIGPCPRLLLCRPHKRTVIIIRRKMRARRWKAALFGEGTTIAIRRADDGFRGEARNQSYSSNNNEKRRPFIPPLSPLLIPPFHSVLWLFFSDVRVSPPRARLSYLVGTIAKRLSRPCTAHSSIDNIFFSPSLRQTVPVRNAYYYRRRRRRRYYYVITCVGRRMGSWCTSERTRVRASQTY